MDVEYYRNALFNGGTKEGFETALVLSLGWFWMLSMSSGYGQHNEDIYGMVKPIRIIRTIFDPYDSMHTAD